MSYFTVHFEFEKISRKIVKKKLVSFIRLRSKVDKKKYVKCGFFCQDFATTITTTGKREKDMTYYLT